MKHISFRGYFDALRSDDVDKVMEILEERPFYANKCDDDGETALCVVVRHNSIDVLHHLCTLIKNEDLYLPNVRST